MIRLSCVKPGAFEYQEVKIPVCPSGYALIRIRKAGICGTDLHAYRGTQPYFNYPRVLGHELAGELVSFNGELPAGLALHQHVTVIPYFHCGNCIACQSGKPNCCSSLKVAGVHVDGGMCEYFSVPASFVIPGRGLDLASLALVEPLAIGAHAVARAAIQRGESVLIMGCGPIGLGVVQFALLAGARVTAMDINAFRLGSLKDLLQPHHTVDASMPEFKKELADMTAGQMFSVVIDATGNRAVINNGLDFLAHGGRYVLVGLQKGDLVFNHPEFHKREATLMSSRNATINHFHFVIEQLTSGAVNAKAFVTHHFPFDQVADCFKNILETKSNVLKALVDF